MDADQMGEAECASMASATSSFSTPKGTDLRKRAQKRTPFTGPTRVNSSFKLPRQECSAHSGEVGLEQEVEDLRKKCDELNKEIILLKSEGYRVEELATHIDLLHEYNDIKDIGQTLLGRIASLRGATTRDLYSHFGLELDD